MQKKILLLSVLFTFIVGTVYAGIAPTNNGTTSSHVSTTTNADDLQEWTYTFIPNDSGDSGDNDDIRDLSHDHYYTWGIGFTDDSNSVVTNRVVSGEEEIISASFTFTNIYDTTSGPSWLHIHLINDLDVINLPDNGSGLIDVDGHEDTAYNSIGTANDYEFVDGARVPLNEFEGIGHHLTTWTTETSDNPDGEIPSGYYNRKDLTYEFTADDIAALTSYLDNNSFGFGFDPDCHFMNTGFSFTFTTMEKNDTPGESPVPEPTTMVLFGFGMLCAASRMRKIAQK